jgi:hypothetical protein
VAAVLLAMKLHNMPTKLINGKHWMLHEKCNADPKKVEGRAASALLHAETRAAAYTMCIAVTQTLREHVAAPTRLLHILQWRWTSCWT